MELEESLLCLPKTRDTGLEKVQGAAPQTMRECEGRHSCQLHPACFSLWSSRCKKQTELYPVVLVQMGTGGMEQPTLSPEWEDPDCGRHKEQWRGGSCRMNVCTVPSPSVISSSGKCSRLE